MQTFLPYADFARSAAVLDRQRLGKQRSENLQIMMAILEFQMTPDGFIPGPQPAWITKHWVTDMWRGHELALLNYHYAICYEWVHLRSYKDTTKHKMNVLTEGESLGSAQPPWLGDKNVHRAYKSVLVQKDEMYYRQHFPNVRGDLDYLHPTGTGALFS